MLSYKIAETLKTINNQYISNIFMSDLVADWLAILACSSGWINARSLSNFKRVHGVIIQSRDVHEKYPTW